jgi:acetolactate synthase-1/2/3 large subunit
MSAACGSRTERSVDTHPANPSATRAEHAREIIPEIVRKAFKVAKAERPGCSFIEFPENIAAETVEDLRPLRIDDPRQPWPPEDKLEHAASLIAGAAYALVLAGNGVIRAGAAEALQAFAEKLRIPVTMTFMAKGAIPRAHPMSLGTAGLSANDFIACGFGVADVVICVGYDIVEYHPERWHRDPA